MVPIERTLSKYSAYSNIFWELGYQDTPLFPGLVNTIARKAKDKKTQALLLRKW